MPIDNPSPSAQRFSDEQLFMAAQLYYERNLSQADVARALAVSQPQVSRILALARDRGIVKITVSPFDQRDRNLEKDLCDRLPLTSAMVMRVGPELSGEQLRQTIGHFAAPFISSMIDDAETITIAGGRTLGAAAPHMAASDGSARERVFVQSMGHAGASPESWDALEIGRTIAQAWGSPFLMLNTPAFVPDGRSQRMLVGLDQVQTVLQKMSQSDLALVGVGTLTNSVFVERKVLTTADYTKLKKAGAVGEICGRFYGPDGLECETQLKQRVISMSLDDVRRVKNVAAVVVGVDRSQALQAAIQGGLVKTLIIDSPGAAALLETIAKQSKSIPRKR